MSEAAKLIFGFPVMIDGFATASSVLPVRHFALLDDVAQTLKALRYFDDGGMVFLWGETDSSGEQTFNDTLSGRRSISNSARSRRLAVAAENSGVNPPTCAAPPGAGRPTGPTSSWPIPRGTG